MKRNDNEIPKEKITKIEKPVRNIKPIVHMNNDLKVLWNIEDDCNLTSSNKIFGGYIESIIVEQTVEKWIQNLTDLIEYIEENKYCPSQKSTLGCWLSNQHLNYKSGINIMKKHNNVKILWENFINKYQNFLNNNINKWNINLQNLELYINNNGITPPSTLKLGQWFADQKQNYKNNVDTIMNPIIRLKWENFLEKYAKYLDYNKCIWLNMLGQCRDYIDTNKEKPSSTTEEGKWIMIQKRHYKNNQHMFKHDDIIEKWIEFINIYNTYPVKKIIRKTSYNKNKWISNLTDLKNHIKAHGLPSQTGDYKILRQWSDTQQKNYKNHTQIMTERDIIELWENFVKEHKNLYINQYNLIKK